MCKPKKPPPVVQRDPVAEAAAAANTAQASANAETSTRRRRRQGQSLFAMGSGTAGMAKNDPSGSLYAMAAPGATTLGG